jgi:hypothetical protein
VRRVLITVFAGLCIAATILYVVDYAIARFGRAPFGNVIVTHYYEIPKKNGKTEFVFLPPELQKCVHSLFPHLGYAPCWYLNGHAEQPVKM